METQKRSQEVHRHGVTNSRSDSALMSETFKSALRTLKLLQQTREFNKKITEKPSCRRDESSKSKFEALYGADISFISELNALLTLQEYAAGLSELKAIIDISDILKNESHQEEILSVRMLSTRTDAAIDPDMMKILDTHRIDAKEFTIALLCDHFEVSLGHTIDYDSILTPVWVRGGKSGVQGQLSSMKRLLNEERRKMLSADDIANDDCFAVLKLLKILTNSIPKSPFGCTDARLPFLCDIFIHILRDWGPTHGSSNLYAANALGIINVATEFLELPQTHKVEDQVLGTSLLYRTLNVTSSGDLLDFVPWLLPKIQGYSSFITEGEPYYLLHRSVQLLVVNTSLQLCSLRCMHATIHDLCKHTLLYHNPKSLQIDLLLIMRVVSVFPRTILKCNMKGLVLCLLTNLQFWQPLIQGLCVGVIMEVMQRCPDGVLYHIRKINLELLRLCAYYVPNILSPNMSMGQEAEKKLIIRVLSTAVLARSYCKREWDLLYATFQAHDAASSVYIDDVMDSITRSP